MKKNEGASIADPILQHEYSKTYESPFKGTDGLPARLFSSYDYSTSDLHFKWIRQYGIDGIFLQRFVTEISNKPDLQHNDQVMRNAIKASSKYDRAFCIMCALSGMQDKDWITVIKDWKHLVDELFSIPYRSLPAIII